MNIAVLSRGYKRKTNGFVEVETNMSVREVGDEPLQIKTKFPDGFDFAKDCNEKEDKVVVADIVDFKIVRYWVFWKRAEITKF